jgi:hypothetical protein
MTVNYWLMKSEPNEFSIMDLKNSPGKTAHWDGVRNYQARNFMRDKMRVGDRVLFYHSVGPDIRTSRHGTRKVNTLIPEVHWKIRSGIWSTFVWRWNSSNRSHCPN